MKTILAIAAIVGVWAMAASIAWSVVARGTEEVCVCDSDYDDFNDLYCKDCD
jgi:hypothetical protein